MTATDELLPCPFCGGEAHLVKQTKALFLGGKKVWWEVIHKCRFGNHVSTGYCGTKTEAKRMWNRRAED